MKKIALLFYLSGSIILIIPVLASIYFPFKLSLFISVADLLYFRINYISIALLLISSLIIICYDLFFFNNKKQFNKNFQIIKMIIGSNSDILYLALISGLSGLFEELLFRGYLFFIADCLKYNYLLFLPALIILSNLFALLHIIQGKEAYIISLILSFIFYFSVIISKTLWHAVITHALINFLEFYFIIPYQNKKFGSNNTCL